MFTQFEPADVPEIDSVSFAIRVRTDAVLLLIHSMSL